MYPFLKIWGVSPSQGPRTEKGGGIRPSRNIRIWLLEEREMDVKSPEGTCVPWVLFMQIQSAPSRCRPYHAALYRWGRRRREVK